MKKYFLVIFCLFFFIKAESKSTNVLMLSCEYDPNLIKKEQRNIGIIENQKLNLKEICRSFGCMDTVEINTDQTSSLGKDKYRLRNSWFNHQGILLENFKLTKKSVSIDTFVSQAYFVETYSINRVSGKTQRTFYRFDNSEVFYKIQELENDLNNEIPHFNKKNKLSLKTLESLSLKPLETFFFHGICLEGTGV